MGVSPRLPTEADLEAMKAGHEATAPDPEHFFPFLENLQPAVAALEGWSDAASRGIAGPTLLIVGDQDFVRPEHAALCSTCFPTLSSRCCPARLLCK